VVDEFGLVPGRAVYEFGGFAQTGERLEVLQPHLGLPIVARVVAREWDAMGLQVAFELGNPLDYGPVCLAPIAMKLLLTESGLSGNEIV